MWIKVKVNNNDHHITGNIYRPNTYPKASPSKFNNALVDIINFFKSHTEFKKCKIHIMGGFNLDLLKFNLHKPTEEFKYHIYSFGCIPIIKKPTHIHSNSATLISNILTTSNQICYSGIVLSDNSDHNIIFVIEDISTNKNYSTIKRPDMSDRNITSFAIVW